MAWNIVAGVAAGAVGLWGANKSAKAAGIPFILLEDGYTEKKVSEIYHDYLVKDFVNIEQIISKYLDH